MSKAWFQKFVDNTEEVKVPSTRFFFPGCRSSIHLHKRRLYYNGWKHYYFYN